MPLITDMQTLEDLNILGSASKKSIFALFNRTRTRGGAKILKEMFQAPFSKEEDVSRRSGIISYISETGITFPYRGELFDATEQYLADDDDRTKLYAKQRTLGSRLGNMISQSTSEKIIFQGIDALRELLEITQSFIESLIKADGTPYHPTKLRIQEILAEPSIRKITFWGFKTSLSFEAYATSDEILRFSHKTTIQELLSLIYELDVYIAVGKTAVANKFVFTKALKKEEGIIRIEGLYHPQLTNPVSNSVSIDSSNNVVFLTGVNMAGKSTFMKALGTALFLGHMGFPVPASKMEFSVMDGIYTTINLSDNLSSGASHFYTEVLRVKKVAMELGRRKKLFVIFDELFRGTNVKDAYEATIAITSAFAKIKGSVFVISTHIVEAGPVLRDKHENITFKFLSAELKENLPVYSYKLQSGITQDRHGMIIIENEGILEILQEKKHQTL